MIRLEMASPEEDLGLAIAWLQAMGGDFRCVSIPFIHRCLSTEGGTVAVAQYRLMLGKGKHSAPTDAPTRSRLSRSLVRSLRSFRRWFHYKAKPHPVNGAPPGKGHTRRFSSSDGPTVAGASSCRAKIDFARPGR